MTASHTSARRAMTVALLTFCVIAAAGCGWASRLRLSGGTRGSLRLEARVARDDGERGLYLEFENLWPGAPDLIERLLKTLPLVSPGEGRFVISEVIEGNTLA